MLEQVRLVREAVAAEGPDPPEVTAGTVSRAAAAADISAALGVTALKEEVASTTQQANRLQQELEIATQENLELRNSLKSAEGEREREAREMEEEVGALGRRLARAERAVEDAALAAASSQAREEVHASALETALEKAKASDSAL